MSSEKAGWRERLAVRFHLLRCRHCRRYMAQLRAIGAPARNLWGPLPIFFLVHLLGEVDADTISSMMPIMPLGLRASPHSPGSCRRTGRILSSVRKNRQPKAWTQCPGMSRITAPSPRLAISRWKNSRSRSRLASKPLTSGFVKSGRSSCVRMSSVSARSPL